jgi:hypothetical protein
MQSTPPDAPSPQGDGEVYDIKCQGIGQGIDFYVAVLTLDQALCYPLFRIQ